MELAIASVILLGGETEADVATCAVEENQGFRLTNLTWEMRSGASLT